MSKQEHWVPHTRYLEFGDKICCHHLAECNGRPFKGDRYVISLNGMAYLVVGRLHSVIEDSCLYITPLLHSESDDESAKLITYRGKFWVQGKQEIVKAHIPASAKQVSQTEAKDHVAGFVNGYHSQTETTEWMNVNGITVRTYISHRSHGPHSEFFYRDSKGEIQIHQIRDPRTTLLEQYKANPVTFPGEEEQLMLL